MCGFPLARNPATFRFGLAPRRSLGSSAAFRRTDPYEYLRDHAVKRIGELKRERLPPVASASDPETLREALSGPPKGFWAWQGKTPVLRTVVWWHAAQKKRPSPWPDPRALRIRTAPARELPFELQSVEGRRRLIEGLKAIDSKTARADLLLCYTGLRCTISSHWTHPVSRDRTHLIS